VLEGNIGSLKDMPGLSEEFAKIEFAASKIPTMAGKRMFVLQNIMKDFGSIMKGTGVDINDPFVKLNGTLKKLTESAKGLFEVLKGVGGVLLGVLAPLAAGIGMFAFGPVVGAIGTIVGGLLSATLGVIVGTLFRKNGTSKIEEKISALIDLITQLFKVFVGIYSGDKNVKGVIGGKTLGALGMDKDTAATMFRAAAAMANLIGSFIDGFIKEFDKFIGPIKKSIKNTLKNLFGDSKDTPEGNLESFGALFGSVLGNLAYAITNQGGTILVFFDKIVKLLSFVKFPQYLVSQINLLGTLIDVPIKFLTFFMDAAGTFFKSVSKSGFLEGSKNAFLKWIDGLVKIIDSITKAIWGVLTFWKSDAPPEPPEPTLNGAAPLKGGAVPGNAKSQLDSVINKKTNAPPSFSFDEGDNKLPGVLDTAKNIKSMADDIRAIKLKYLSETASNQSRALRGN